MKPSQKIFVCSCILAALALTGCASDSTKDSEPSVIAETTAPVVATETSFTEVTPTTIPSSEQPTGGEDALSDNWSDLDLKIDGVVFKYPYSCKELEEHGWALVQEDARGLEAGAKVMSSFSLENKNYYLSEKDLRCRIGCGFINNGSEFAELKDCDIWSLNFSFQERLEENLIVPEIEIAKNIHLGCTEEEIVEAFGPYTEKREQRDPYTSKMYDNVIYKLNSNGRDITLELSVDKNIGLFAMYMNAY